MNYESFEEYERLINLGIQDDYAFIIACTKGNQLDLAEEKKKSLQKEQEKIQCEMVKHEFTPLQEILPLTQDPNLNYIEHKEHIESLEDINRCHPDFRDQFHSLLPQKSIEL